MATQIDSLEVKVQSQATSAITSLNNLEKKLLSLSKTMSSLNGSGLKDFSDGVLTLGRAVQQIRSVDSRSFSTLANNINKLSNVNYAGLARSASAISSISASIGTLSNMGSGIANISQLADSIRKLGYKSVDTAINNMPRLAVAMNQLMASLSKAPKVSRNIIDMTNALANLTTSGYRFGNASGSVNRGFLNISKSANKAHKSVKSLAYYFGKMYASYFLLFRLFGKVKDMIDLSSSTTELGNVVAVTFGQYQDKLDKFTQDSITKYGMSELTAMKVSSRFQAMGTAMGFTADKMSDMSIRLTELTSDMASFYDVTQEDVAEDLESIFTGMTRPLRTYGLDLTEATLKEWAMKNGLDANIKSMTQAEKTLLRYQYVLANTTQVNGDFQRTMNTWHNQITILKANLQQLGVTWGNAFVNMLKPALQYLNVALVAFNRFSEGVVNALGQIFGWKLEITSGGITQDIEDADSALQDATGDAKKLKQQLQGIDELNVLNKDSSSSGTSGSTSSGSYTQPLYNIEETESKYKSSIKDLESLGKSISDALKKSMDNIDWNAIYQKASNFGSGLASFLNGLFEKSDSGDSLFKSLGHTIASSLNTVLYSVFSFSETFDWFNFGDTLHDGIDEAIKTFDWKNAGFTVGSVAKGIATSIYAFVKDKSTWSNLGDSIGDGLNSFFKSMDTKDKKTGLTGWQALGKSISSTISGIATTMKTALKKVDWQSVGKAIGEFINSIDWKQVVFDLADLASEVVKAIKDALKGLYDENPIAGTIVSLLATAFAGVNTLTLLSRISGNSLRNTFLSALAKTIGGTLTSAGTIALTFAVMFEVLYGISKWYSNTDWYKKTEEAVGTQTASTLTSQGASNNTSFDLWNYFFGNDDNGKEKSIDVKANITSAGVSKDLITPSIDSNANLTTYKDIISGNKSITGYEGQVTTYKDIISGSKTLTGYQGQVTTYRDIISGRKKLSNVNAEVNSYTDKIYGDKKLKNFTSVINKFQMDGVTSIQVTGTNGSIHTIYRENGGVYRNGHWKSIDQYASGGIPTHGTHFVAGENGAEVVGHINGSTEVLNQSQLASVMYNAVVEGMKNVIGSFGGDTVVNIDGREVARATKSYADTYTRRTGNPYFAY